jgi:hypothetical protein
MHKGIATRKTTIEAVKSRARNAPIPLFCASWLILRPPQWVLQRSGAKRERDRQFGIFAQRHEVAGVTIKTQHLSGMNVHEPAVERHFTFGNCRGDRGVGTQMRNLGNDVFQRHGAHPVSRP